MRLLNKSRRFWLFVGLTTAGLALLNALAFIHARAMLFFTHSGDQTDPPEALSRMQKLGVLLQGVNVPRPADDRDLAELKLKGKAITIPVNQAVLLEGYLCDQGHRRPLVILFHGYAGDKTSLVDEANGFIDLGCSVLLVDFRGSGGSNRAYTTIGVHEAEDVAAAVRYAESNLQYQSLILYGFSMGSAAVLRAISHESVEVDGVVLEAVFNTMLQTVRNRFHALGLPSVLGAELLVFWGGFQFGFNGFRHQPVRYARANRAPTLLLQGQEDSRGTMPEAQAVYEAIQGPSRLASFPHVGHEGIAALDPRGWRDAVRELVEFVEITHRPKNAIPA